MSDDTKVNPTVASITEKKAEQKEITQKMEQIERTTGSSGAIPFEPKRTLLDATSLEKDNSDKRFRWVNVNNNERAQARQAQGYTRVPVAEGGRQVGNLALFSLPREAYRQRVAAIEQLGKDRLNAHKAEVEQMADAVARELRDRHGIHVDAERIIIRE